MPLRPEPRDWNLLPAMSEIVLRKLRVEEPPAAQQEERPRRASPLLRHLLEYRFAGVSGAHRAAAWNGAPDGPALRPSLLFYRKKRPGRAVLPSSPEPLAPEAVCLWLVCFRYRLPNFPHSAACDRRERQRLGMLPDGFQSALLLCLIQFVDLGRHHNVRMVIGLEPFFEVEVFLHPAAAGVHDQK